MRRLIIILVVIFAPALVKADTMKLVDNSSINGAVRYLPEIFEITGKFRMPGGNETKAYQVKREKVKFVLINNNTNNPGPPPPGINKYEIDFIDLLKFGTNREKSQDGPDVRLPRDVQSTSQDLVILKNGSSKSGTLSYIKDDLVGINNEIINRADVASIRVGPP